MSIIQRIAIVLATAFIAVLLTMSAIQFMQTRNFLVQQMEATTRNTVSSLGIGLIDYLATPTQLGDLTIDSTLNAVFDSGSYELIEVTRYADNWTMRKQNDSNAMVPAWFLALVPMPQPAYNEVLTNGWIQTAEITVIASPNLAYQQMWQSTLQVLAAVLAIAILVCVWVGIGVVQLLSPIRAVEEQSKRLEEQHIGAQIPVPKTRELKHLVEAFNKLSLRVSQQFSTQDKLLDQYRQQAFQDELTGYSNRSFLLQQLPMTLNALGAISVVGVRIGDANAPARPSDFKQFIRILEFTTQCIDSCLPNPEIRARLSDYEFFVVVSKLPVDQLQSLQHRLQQRLAEHQLADEMSLLLNANVVAFTVDEDLPVSTILTKLDQGFTGIQQKASKESPALTGKELKTWLSLQIERHNVDLLQQPIVAASDQHDMHWEVFGRTSLVEVGLSTAEFYAALSEFQLGREWDRVVIQQALERSHHRPLAINLTPDIALDGTFLHWLNHKIADKKSVIFELTEAMVCQSHHAGFNLAKALKANGYQVGIDRVGNEFASLSYLSDLKPLYAKIDPVFTQLAVSEKRNQMFIGSLASTIHSLGIPVIATRVEMQDELALLEDFAIDGIQGYLHRPEPIGDL